MREPLGLGDHEALHVLAARCNKGRAMARELDISLRQLQRMFRTQLRCSPQAWLREARLH